MPTKTAREILSWLAEQASRDCGEYPYYDDIDSALAQLRELVESKQRPELESKNLMDNPFENALNKLYNTALKEIGELFK